MQNDAMKIRIGLIRVLTTDDKKLLNSHGEKIMSFFPNLDVESRCIHDQPEGIHDDETEEIAVPKVVALAKQMEKEGFKAVIISCAGDPGVKILSEELKIPVIGAGRAAAGIARALDLPIGVLGLTEKVPQAISEILGKNQVADIVPEGVVSTLDLMKPHGMKAMIAAGHELKRKGARAILLACTGMSTIGAADVLEKALGLPVIDPVRSEGGVLKCLNW